MPRKILSATLGLCILAALANSVRAEVLFEDDFTQLASGAIPDTAKWTVSHVGDPDPATIAHGTGSSGLLLNLGNQGSFGVNANGIVSHMTFTRGLNLRCTLKATRGGAAATGEGFNGPFRSSNILGVDATYTQALLQDNVGSLAIWINNERFRWDEMAPVAWSGSPPCGFGPECQDSLKTAWDDSPTNGGVTFRVWLGDTAGGFCEWSLNDGGTWTPFTDRTLGTPVDTRSFAADRQTGDGLLPPLPDWQPTDAPGGSGTVSVVKVSGIQTAYIGFGTMNGGCYIQYVKVERDDGPPVAGVSAGRWVEVRIAMKGMLSYRVGRLAVDSEIRLLEWCVSIRSGCRRARAVLSGWTALTAMVAVFASPVVCRGAGDWAQWRGPRRDGISPETGWLSDWSVREPKQLWKVSAGTGFTAPVFKSDRLYLVGNEKGTTDTVRCFNPAEGEELWKYSYPCEAYAQQHNGGPSATPVVDEKSVYVFSKGGEVICLDAASGEKRWNRRFKEDVKNLNVNYGCSASPLVDDKAVYVDVGVAYALNKKTGETIWASNNLGMAFASPMPYDYRGTPAVLFLNSGGVFILAKADGKVLAQYVQDWLKTLNAATPIVTEDNRILLVCSSGLLELKTNDQGELEVMLQKPEFANQQATPVLYKGYLYGFTQPQKEFRCMEVKTGSVKWSKGGMGNGTVGLAGGKLLILSETGELIVAEPSPEGFEIVSQLQVLGGTCWTTPVLLDKKIYCRNSKGECVCLDVAPPS